MVPEQVCNTSIGYWNNKGFFKRPDMLAVEEPLEIRLQAALETKPVAVAMRTP